MTTDEAALGVAGAGRRATRRLWRRMEAIDREVRERSAVADQIEAWNVVRWNSERACRATQPSELDALPIADEVYYDPGDDHDERIRGRDRRGR